MGSSCPAAISPVLWPQIGLQFLSPPSMIHGRCWGLLGGACDSTPLVGVTFQALIWIMARGVAQNAPVPTPDFASACPHQQDCCPVQQLFGSDGWGPIYIMAGGPHPALPSIQAGCWVLALALESELSHAAHFWRSSPPLSPVDFARYVKN